MNNIKQELLELESKHGRNVHARRLYNEALQGGGFREFIRRMFGRKPPVPKQPTQYTLKEPTSNPTPQPQPTKPTKPTKRSYTSSTAPTQSMVPTKKPTNSIDWEKAYCTFYRIMMESLSSMTDPVNQARLVQENETKLQRVNAYFRPVEAGGGGDCFFFSLLYYNATYLNSKRIYSIIQRCHENNIDDQVKCLRETVYRMANTKDIDSLQRIKTMGKWMRDEDIVVIANTLNIIVYLYSQVEGFWRLYEPFSPTPNCPIFYMINLGTTIKNGSAGYHYQPLLREQDGNFSC